tara:strand:- start:49 stop:930 length:882 start_codon:yes stop_codon:yes gene_type:complete
MKEYKYKLDPTSKKFNCPKCAKKRYVRYINNETNQYADPEFGRCDRAQKCAHHLYPANTKSYEPKYHIDEVKLKASNIRYEILNQTIKRFEINPLVQYLFNNYEKNEVNQIIKKYNIGTANMYKGATVFWQMDNTGNIRTGKIMSYNTETGKRTKNNDGKPKINWVHSALKKTNYNLKQCLFGLHLLNDNVKQVAIVESEKTALIMSLNYPKYTWMSTGSMSNFKYEILAPLNGKEIIAFPDKGGYNKWKNTADTLNNKGFNVKVSKLLEKKEYKEGWDLADALEFEDKNAIK